MFVLLLIKTKPLILLNINIQYIPFHLLLHAFGALIRFLEIHVTKNELLIQIIHNVHYHR